MVASLIVLGFPMVLSAQDSAKIVSGDTMRVTAKSLGTLDRVGILTKVERDKLLLADPDKNRAAWEIALDRVTRLEVRRPTAGDHRHQGALIGMISGFVVLGGIGYLATHDGGEFDGVGVVLAGPGGGLGALIGFFAGKSQKTDGWARVPLPLK